MTKNLTQDHHPQGRDTPATKCGKCLLLSYRRAPAVDFAQPFKLEHEVVEALRAALARALTMTTPPGMKAAALKPQQVNRQAYLSHVRGSPIRHHTRRTS